MVNSIKSAGFIVVDCQHNAIWGSCPSEDAAWQSLIDDMRIANITVVGSLDDDERPDLAQHETWAKDYELLSASQALLDYVDKNGGDCSWHDIGGVQCTKAEYDAQFDD